MNKLKVGLLGGGSWGTTVASLVAKNTDVSLWARNEATVNEINQEHTNKKYLPDAMLPFAPLGAGSEFDQRIRKRFRPANDSSCAARAARASRRSINGAKLGA